jgi:hypothetical protein
MSAPQKTVEVDPAEEGPKVKAKRHMTEAQLAALKKGREKLAEKRKQAHEGQVSAVEADAGNADASVSANAPVQKDPVDHMWNTQKEEDDDVEEGYAPLCRIM